MLKQFLREKRINDLLHTFRFSSKNQTTITNQRYTLHEGANTNENSPLKLIDLIDKEQQDLKPIVIDFLYYNSETLKNIKVYKILDDTSRYLIVGENKSTIIQMK